MTRAFVIRPFGKKKNSWGLEVDFDQVHQELIAPALTQLEMEGSTVGEVIAAGNIRKDMFEMIAEADVVICDGTIHNANVFYELGVRHALRRGHTIVIRGDETADTPPFDQLTDRYLSYASSDPKATIPRLVAALQATTDKLTRNDSPVFSYLPHIPEAGAAALDNLPEDLSEEITRARASKMKGWLRLLAKEVRGKRFQTAALRAIGEALWRVNDLQPAIEVWEELRKMDFDGIDANLALASLFERSYGSDKTLASLTKSDQALARLNARESALTREKRAEIRALAGRNAKTRWRVALTASTTDERRKQALSTKLRESYENYRDAYLLDLNHYWSGLAALQMCTIARSLAAEPGFMRLFPSDAKAREFVAQLEDERAQMRNAVDLAIQAAAPDVWKHISRADWQFMFEESDERVLQAYEDTLTGANAFEWDAARRQLQLFANLGIRSELAQRVIQRGDEVVAPPPAAARVIVFAGHRVDESGRAEPRFPPDKEERARGQIRLALQQLHARHPQLLVLASAAPGSDILCHELCTELAIESVVCLPMPKEAVARLAYGDLDGWRNRFFDVIGSRQVLQLSDQEGLPRWLRSSSVDPWERGNAWTLEMARSLGGSGVILLALWDRKTCGDAPGGTGHMVELARKSGDVKIEVIEAGTLLV